MLREIHTLSDSKTCKKLKREIFYEFYEKYILVLLNISIVATN